MFVLIPQTGNFIFYGENNYSQARTN